MYSQTDRQTHTHTPPYTSHRKLVLPGRSIVVQVSLAAEAVGSYTILCNMHSDQLTDVRGSTQLHVTP